MYKQATYKQKFAALNEWIPHIIDSVKKDLKNEHLKKDYLFAKKYFASKNINKLTSDELVEAYKQAIAESDEAGEAIAEYISSRWIMKNTDVYNLFEMELSQINPNFSDIEELSNEHADQLIDASISEHGALNTYLFAVLNSVVLPKGHFDALQKRAQAELEEEVAQLQDSQEKVSMEKMQISFEQEIARLTDKYEKKLSGLQKKYHLDVDALKKQNAQLQRKLHEKAKV